MSGLKHDDENNSEMTTRNFFVVVGGGRCAQSLHRLEKYLNIQDCLEKSLTIIFALKSTWKMLKGLEKSLVLEFYHLQEDSKIVSMIRT